MSAVRYAYIYIYVSEARSFRQQRREKQLKTELKGNNNFEKHLGNTSTHDDGNRVNVGKAFHIPS